MLVSLLLALALSEAFYRSYLLLRGRVTRTRDKRRGKARSERERHTKRQC